MISQSQIDCFKETGIWYTGIPVYSASTHISCLGDFLSKERNCKHSFLQKEFNYLFEGYSFLGQEDSLNQDSKDNVFTYVLSDFFDPARHPKEFQRLIKAQTSIIQTICKLEKELLLALDPSLISFFEHQTGHMLSANYYPASESAPQRLTEHPDVSLFTVFPFGMDEEFKFEALDGSWQTVEKTDEIVCFSGYLLECLTDIKALNHKVEKTGSQHERFSFAYFSIPKPQQIFEMNQEKVTSEEYFTRYLSLFD